MTEQNNLLHDLRTSLDCYLLQQETISQTYSSPQTLHTLATLRFLLASLPFAPTLITYENLLGALEILGNPEHNSLPQKKKRAKRSRPHAHIVLRRMVLKDIVRVLYEIPEEKITCSASAAQLKPCIAFWKTLADIMNLRCQQTNDPNKKNRLAHVHRHLKREMFELTKEYRRRMKT